ncbi:MAG: ChaN family lipoprotein [Alphaproteobacteria bacterium]|nr:ChaN family lipoprotein [Alphaproteobacteria bacterium]
MRWRWLVALCVGAALYAPIAEAAGGPCVPVGRWLEPGRTKPTDTEQMIDEAVDRRIVLMGEVHEQAEHQRWVLHTIAALYGRRPDMVLGFEAFPRRAQPVLDRWVAGELDERSFLAASEWYRVWGYDPTPYLPIFHFARQNRVRMVALNVDRAVVARVGREGLAQVPPAEREGVGDPSPARPAYVDRLGEVYRQHQEGADAPRPDPLDPRFLRFVDAQLLWDRAMAEALNAASRARKEPLVVALMGAGHLENRDGVPHQLAALGRKDAYVLLPWNEGRDCAQLRKGFADAVFGMGPAAPAASTPRLGVALDPDPEGARIRRVVEGGVAAAAGLKQGDVVLVAAGQVIADPGALSDVLRRQAPGTLLPLIVRRDGKFVDLVAEF